MKGYLHIKKEDLGMGSPIASEVLDNEQDVFYELARIMFDEIKTNNEKDKNTVFICPVGPVGQYRKFARLVNKYSLSLKNVYIFNMDEYLDEECKLIPIDHPLSFRRIMETELYERVPEELGIPKENRFFPEPGRECYIWDKICELGGVDICFGGVGINGHIAFNEPPEDKDVTIEEFRNTSTRVLKISKETRTINSSISFGGAIEAFPEYCITLGMKEVLSAKKIRLGLVRDWQRGVVRQILHGPCTPYVPATLIQKHDDAKLIISSTAAEQPFRI